MNDAKTTTNDVVDAVASIRNAFGVFEIQSAVLRQSYESLKKDLATANRRLSVKNKALSAKVAELEEMSSRLECILDSLTDGVLVINHDLQVERCNAAAAVLMGGTRHQVEGRSYTEVTNGFGDIESVKAAIEGGRSCVGRQRSRTNENGEIIVVLAGVAPIRVPDGSVSGAVEILHDVTVLRQLEAKVSNRERMAALGEMAASVAHEIRNPLGTIEGFARLLKRDVEAQPQPYRLASKIVEGAQNLNYVITNLLTYARPMALTCESFSVERLIEEIREVLESRASRAGVALDIKGDDGEAHGDVRQLRQVLLNIGANAIEACHKDGRVEIRVIRCGRNHRYVVSDNGCGIEPGDRDKLFDPFFTRKHGGTGLGLSLCHKIVEAHGGEINVESEPGQGSRFEFIIPENNKEAA